MLSKNNESKDSDGLKDESSCNLNNTNNSAESYDNDMPHRAVKVPDSLDISSEFPPSDCKDTQQTEGGAQKPQRQEHCADDEGRSAHEGFTPASEETEYTEVRYDSDFQL